MELQASIKKLYEDNRRTHGDFQYTVPSPSSYPYQWLWDSCFHAIVLSHFDNKSAEKELLSVVAKQFDSGLLPHIIYWQPQNKLQFDWGVADTSAITQPPIIAYAVWRVFKASGNTSFLESMYSALKKYYDYLLLRKDTSTGLLGIINPDESGEDNSPRFDSSLNLPSKHSVSENNAKRFELFAKNKTCNFDIQHCMKNHFWVQDVPFNSHMVENLNCMHDIALVLGKSEQAAHYEQIQQELKQAMKEHMLHDGIFLSLDSCNNKIDVMTWAVFTPLLANLYTEEEAVSLIKNFLHNNKMFGGNAPVPTTALFEPGFTPTESVTEPAELHPNWRGPIWMATNWMICRGLKKYGFTHEATILAQKSKQLILNGGLREYYSPYTGKGMGAKQFTWSGLVLDMID